MKDKITKRIASFLVVIIGLVLTVSMTSCSETETTDSTKFIISYSGMTDIGPAMQGVISKPAYKGAAPSNFAITHVTLNGETFNENCFTINEESGEISINSSKETPVGLYKISVSCVSNGNSYEFNDAVEVNFMKPVPDGITMNPNSITVKYGVIISSDAELELPTSKVTTDGNHITIKGYKIANVRKGDESVDNKDSKLFSISEKGELSITKGQTGIELGTYVLDLKLITGSVSEQDEEGIFENAIEITVVSAPEALVYNPAEDQIEEEVDGAETSFTMKQAPTFFGSTDELRFSIKSVSPEAAKNKFSINEQNGIISVAKGHGFKKDAKYELTINVANKFAPEGVDFAKAFTLNVVGYIVPVSDLEYKDKYSVIQTKEMADIAPIKTVLGSDVKFSATIPEPLNKYVTFDEKTGVFTTLKDVILPVSDKKDTQYKIEVKAYNTKNEIITDFIYEVKRNPYHIEYIRYGNNLGLTPAENYANQFRIKSDQTIADLNSYLEKIKPETGVNDDVAVSWDIKSLHNSSGTTIDNNGVLTLAGISANQCGTVLVTAKTTDPKGELSSTLTIPVFFQFTGTASTDKNINIVEQIEFTPFVIRANPETGNVYDQPTITCSNIEIAKIQMDYRRSFNFYPITNEQKFIKGQPKDTNSFLGTLWRKYFGNNFQEPADGKDNSFGSKDPLSYYKNLGESSTKALGYIEPKGAGKFEVVVNENKWMIGSEYANGILYGQIAVTAKENPTEKELNDGNQRFSMLIWFDTKFKK